MRVGDVRELSRVTIRQAGAWDWTENLNLTGKESWSGEVCVEVATVDGSMSELATVQNAGTNHKLTVYRYSMYQ